MSNKLPPEILEQIERSAHSSDTASAETFKAGARFGYELATKQQDKAVEEIKQAMEAIAEVHCRCAVDKFAKAALQAYEAATKGSKG